MELTITLSKGQIILRAKDDTYLAVRSYLVGHESNALSKYEMQADERTTHERKLLNSIGTALSELKLLFPGYTINDTLEDGKDSFDVEFEVSERIDFSKRKDIERLVGEYLYKRITYEWWQSNYPDASSPYAQSCAQVSDALKQCFVLKNPYESIDGVKYKCLNRRGYRVVLLYKEEILNEIHSEMLRLSRMKSDMKLQTSEIDDETMLTRYINRYVGRISNRINAYLYELSNTVDNDRMDRTPVYEFKLVMPSGWDDRLFEQLAEEMHGYVVNATLFEWMKTVDEKTASIYGSQSETAWNSIKHIVSVRRGGVNKPLQPF